MGLITKQPGSMWAKGKVEPFLEASAVNNPAKVREAVGLLFPALPEDLRGDYGAIAHHLMKPGSVAYDDAIEAAAGQAQTALAAERGKPNTSVSHLLTRLMRGFGFADIRGVYFVGDAGAAFERVVRNKTLFVDGISWGHGEFTHTIQWLYLCHAKATNALVTNKSIAELYAESVKFTSPFTFLAEQGGGPVEREATVWDFCVDCFLPGKVSYPPNLVENRFSITGRAPAWVQAQLLGGTLQHTVIGHLLQERYERLQFGGKPMSESLPDHPDELAAFYKDRAMGKMRTKPRVYVPGTKVLIPDPTVGKFNTASGQLGQKPAVQASGTGRLLTSDDLGVIEGKAKGYAVHGKAPADPLDKAWLEVTFPEPS